MGLLSRSVRTVCESGGPRLQSKVFRLFALVLSARDNSQGQRGPCACGELGVAELAPCLRAPTVSPIASRRPDPAPSAPEELQTFDLRVL
jgi:hypothetical protein